MSTMSSLSKIERLRVASTMAPKRLVEQDFAAVVDAAKAGALAPELANEAVRLDEKKRARRVKIVGRDGTVVRELTVADLRESLAKRHEIEFGVSDGKRPDRAHCVNCKRSISVKAMGRIPSHCIGGCPCECGRTVSVAAVHVAMRDGRQPRCASCAGLVRTDMVPGARFGGWTVVEAVDGGRSRVLCECQCGRRKQHLANGLRSGKTTQCAACGNKSQSATKLARTDMIPGARFGGWAVVSRDPSRRGYMVCDCECGARVSVYAGNLRNGKSSRCASCASRKTYALRGRVGQ